MSIETSTNLADKGDSQSLLSRFSRSALAAPVSWLIALWMGYIFVGSIPYKFTRHPDTEHIFGTIGDWMIDTVGKPLGELFKAYGAYGVGTFELLTVCVLFAPVVMWFMTKLRGRKPRKSRQYFHRIGGLMASLVMAGAVFFHLATPLGIVVLHDGQSDGGSLFAAAVSILLLGLFLFKINSADTE